MRSHACGVAAVAVAVAVMLLTGCGALPGAAPAMEGAASPGATAPMDEICADAIVVSCESGGGTTTVVIADSADENVLEFGRRLEPAASASPNSVVLRAENSDARVLDAEVSPPPAWEIPVDAEFEATLSSVLTGAAIPGAVGIVVASGWPYVTVEDLVQFEDVFTRVSATPLFQDGGTYTLQSLDERLRIVHVPARTTDAAIMEVIAVARDYPGAEVLLEAPTSGAQYPTLYVSRLSPAQVTELDARLREPRLATADVDGYALPYVLGSLGESGTTYTGGTFGDVPTE